MGSHKIGQNPTDIETIMGTFELIQLNIICSLWWHIFRIAVFFKLISLPGLRRGEINLTIKIFTLNPNKNFKAGQIGRASCRERVSSQEGGYNLELKVKQQT